MFKRKLFGMTAAVLLAVTAASAPVSAQQEPGGSDLFQVMRREKENIEKQLQATRQELQQERRQQAAVQTRLDAVAADLQAAEQDRRELRDQLRTAGQEQAELEQAVLREAERAEKLMAVIAELKGLVASQAEALASQRGQIDSLESSQAALRKQLQAEKGKSENVAAKIAEARAEAGRAADLAAADRLRAHYNLAVMYDRQRMFAAAEKEYRTCLEINPHDAYVHYNLGILYDDKLSEPQKALEHYRRFLELHPQGEDAEKVREWMAALAGAAK